MQRQGRATIIRVGQGRLGAAFATLFWLSIPLMFGSAGFMVDPVAGLMAGGMTVLLVAIMFGAARLVASSSGIGG